MEKKEAAPTEEARVYELDGIVFVPHYKNRDLYVGPGYPIGAGDPDPKHTRTEFQLVAAGAKVNKILLWPRPQFVAVAAKA